MAREANEGSLPPPVCKAIIPCSRVIVDEPTRLWSLIDIFDEITVYELPASFGPFSLFLTLTDGQGVYQIAVEIHDLKSDQIIAREEQDAIELSDKLSRWSSTLVVPAFDIQYDGLFDVLVLANGQEIARRTIEVHLSTEA